MLWASALGIRKECRELTNYKKKIEAPKTHPKSQNTPKKTPRLHELFRKVRTNFCPLPCDTSQEPSGNCSEKLVQMNFFIFWVDFFFFFGWIFLLWKKSRTEKTPKENLHKEFRRDPGRGGQGGGLGAQIPLCRCWFSQQNTVHKEFRGGGSKGVLGVGLRSNFGAPFLYVYVLFFWQCKYLMYCIFPVRKPLACGRQSRCLGWTYKLPRGQKFSIKLSALSVGFPQRRPLKFNKKTRVYKLPRGAIYKPPCVQLINTPFFAIHQVFALLIFGAWKKLWGHELLRECQKTKDCRTCCGDSRSASWPRRLSKTTFCFFCMEGGFLKMTTFGGSISCEPL